MSRNKFIQDVLWVLILVLYPNLLNVSKEIKKDSLDKGSHITDCIISHKSEQKKSKIKNVEIEER